MKQKFAFALAGSALLLALASATQASPIDANGNALSDPNDGKTTLVDNSKEKEGPQVQESWCQPPPDWEIRIGLPGWMAGMSGDTGAKGVTANIDVPFHELLDHFTHVPLVLSFDVRYQRWEFFGDGQFITLNDSASLPGLLFTNANAHVTSGLGEVFVGYRLLNCQKASFSIFTGIRYTYLGEQLNIFDNGDARLVVLRRLLGIPKGLDFSGNTDWIDPVIGMRGKVKVWKAVSLYAEGDVGGFDVNSGDAYDLHRRGRTIVKDSVDSSDWSYQVQGGVEIQVTRHIWSQIGWRYLKYDYNKGGFTNDTALNGPILTTGINF